MFCRLMAPRTHLSMSLTENNSTHNSQRPALHRLQEPEESPVPWSWSYRQFYVAPLGAGNWTPALCKHTQQVLLTTGLFSQPIFKVLQNRSVRMTSNPGGLWLEPTSSNSKHWSMKLIPQLQSVLSSRSPCFFLDFNILFLSRHLLPEVFLDNYYVNILACIFSLIMHSNCFFFRKGGGFHFLCSTYLSSYHWISILTSRIIILIIPCFLSI